MFDLWPKNGFITLKHCWKDMKPTKRRITLLDPAAKSRTETGWNQLHSGSNIFGANSSQWSINNCRLCRQKLPRASLNPAKSAKTRYQQHLWPGRGTQTNQIAFRCVQHLDRISWRWQKIAKIHQQEEISYHAKFDPLTWFTIFLNWKQTRTQPSLFTWICRDYYQFIWEHLGCRTSAVLGMRPFWRKFSCIDVAPDLQEFRGKSWGFTHHHHPATSKRNMYPLENFNPLLFGTGLTGLVQSYTLIPSHNILIPLAIGGFHWLQTMAFVPEG